MHLLIADDDRDSAHALAELLKLVLPAHVEVSIAYDGHEALEAATTGALLPDIVITDIEMPRMNGIDAAMAIKFVLGSNAPLLIAMTGHADLWQAKATGQVFDHVLRKPVMLDELLSLLR